MPQTWSAGSVEPRFIQQHLEIKKIERPRLSVRIYSKRKIDNKYLHSRRWLLSSIAKKGLQSIDDNNARNDLGSNKYLCYFENPS